MTVASTQYARTQAPTAVRTPGRARAPCSSAPDCSPARGGCWAVLGGRRRGGEGAFEEGGVEVGGGGRAVGCVGVEGGDEDAAQRGLDQRDEADGEDRDAAEGERGGRLHLGGRDGQAAADEDDGE